MTHSSATPNSAGGIMEKIRIEQHSSIGMLWFGGWLFTIGFLKLGFWKAVVGLIVWPYYVGVWFARV
jgi:hypothetical protein